MLRVADLSIGDFGFRIWDLRNPVDFIKTETSESEIQIPQLVPRISSVQSIQSEIRILKTEITLESGDIQPTGQLAHFRTDHFLGFCQGVIDRSQHKIL